MFRKGRLVIWVLEQKWTVRRTAFDSVHYFVNASHSVSLKGSERHKKIQRIEACNTKTKSQSLFTYPHADRKLDEAA